MRNASLDEAKAGIKIARRNINSLRYVNDTTLMAEIEVCLKQDIVPKSHTCARTLTHANNAP